MDYRVVSVEEQQAALEASFLITGFIDEGSLWSKRKREGGSQVGMGFFYAPASALTCAHNLPSAAREFGTVIRAMERGMHPIAQAHIIDMPKHLKHPH